jgi:hypothetical protein
MTPKSRTGYPPRKFRLKGRSVFYLFHGEVNSKSLIEWEKKRMMKEGYYLRVVDRGRGKIPRYRLYRRRM